MKMRSLFAVMAACSLALSGCSSDEEENNSAETTENASESSEAEETEETEETGEVEESESAFPVTIEHKFGSSTVEETPERVVSLGYTDQDAILAAGVTPVMIRDWGGVIPEGEIAGPWAQDLVSRDDVEIYSADEIDFEEIAAVEPDLIVAVHSGIDKDDYEGLSKIAPVIAQSGDYDDYMQPWDVTTIMVGKALGVEDKAEAAVAEVKAKVDALVEAHPEWSEHTITVASYAREKLNAFVPGDTRADFFTNLGFTYNPTISELAGDKFRLELSLEEANKIDADVVVFDQLTFTPGGKDTILNEPAFAALDAVKDGRALFFDEEMEKAFGFQSVLSLGYVLDNIEEPLVEVVK